MKQIPHKDLQVMIASRMRLGIVYTQARLYLYYEEMMKQDAFVSDYKKKNRETFYRFLREWKQFGGIEKVTASKVSYKLTEPKGKSLCQYVQGMWQKFISLIDLRKNASNN